MVLVKHMLIKHNIYFQDLRFDTQSQIIQEVTNKLICEEGLTDKEAQEEADYYINTHNFANEFVM